MRHLRTLGLCVGAALAAVTMTLASASPAMAKKAKPVTFELFNQCPLSDSALAACIAGEAGPESFFQAGKVTVRFKKPITLQGGVEINEETGAETWVNAENGETITKKAEPAPGLTEGIDVEDLPPAEKARYEEYLASGKSTKVTATIELAGSPPIFISTENLLDEEEEAFGFPVQVHLENKFLGKYCYVGNEVHPIEVPFTTGETSPLPPNTPIHGERGSIYGLLEGGVIELKEAHLVNNEYAAPGVQGCGINGGADAALDAGLGLPSPAGSNTTELIGNLFVSSAEEVQGHISLVKRAP